MRQTALWISPWVDHDSELILDTAALVGDPGFLANVAGPDAFPPDTVLLVVHPVRHQQLRERLADRGPESFATLASDPHGRTLAAQIIGRRCVADPDLAQRLRW